MNPEEFRSRTKQYALRIIRMAESLPNTQAGREIRGQLIRCGCSVGANYRAVCRSRSRAEFIAKKGIAEEECDESLYWMELLVEAGLAKSEKLTNLMKEGNEILSMIVVSRKTARSKA